MADPSGTQQSSDDESLDPSFVLASTRTDEVERPGQADDVAIEIKSIIVTQVTLEFLAQKSSEHFHTRLRLSFEKKFRKDGKEYLAAYLDQTDPSGQLPWGTAIIAESRLVLRLLKEDKPTPRNHLRSYTVDTKSRRPSIASFISEINQSHIGEFCFRLIGDLLWGCTDHIAQQLKLYTDKQLLADPPVITSQEPKSGIDNLEGRSIFQALCYDEKGNRMQVPRGEFINRERQKSHDRVRIEFEGPRGKEDLYDVGS
ncbi:hypothetical protein F4780DRAFT_128848 [Xylariomycetidae sp. FL0641]|nr:hypothetical protein F4780DRAFT_128848 [Xylariomycetidae sp. FL0641]